MCRKALIWLKVLLRQASENTMISRLLKLVIILSVVLLIAGCEEPEDEYIVCGKKNPAWLLDLIEEANSKPLYYAASSICEYEYQDSYLIEFDNPLSSCLLCRVYDCDGNLIEWSSQEEITDFMNNREYRRSIWRCCD